jgi:hypothetical protein
MNEVIFISLTFFIFNDSLNDVTIQDNLRIRKKKMTDTWIISYNTEGPISLHA